MSEKNTLYDNLRNPVSIIERGQPIPSGLNKLSVHVWIVNDAGEYLLQQRMGTAKKFPNMWGQTGGGAIAGESSWDACVRETVEELGLTPDPKNSVLVGTIKRPMDFVDIWLVHSNANISELKPQASEVQSVKWTTLADIQHMQNTGEFIPSIVPGFNMVLNYQKMVNPKSVNARDFLGKLVRVQMDRPMGSKHPKHGFTYEVNYGFIPNTISGDGEELDAYVLGIDTPLATFSGKCVAIIHRTNDNDDKLIVVPDVQNPTNEYIEQKTAFQEQWFKHTIIR